MKSFKQFVEAWIRPKGDSEHDEVEYQHAGGDKSLSHLRNNRKYRSAVQRGKVETVPSYKWKKMHNTDAGERNTKTYKSLDPGKRARVEKQKNKEMPIVHKNKVLGGNTRATRAAMRNEPVKVLRVEGKRWKGEAEKWIKANKQRFIKRYGKEKGLNVLYGKASNLFEDLDEALLNKIKKDSSVPEVRNNSTHWPDTYKPESKQIGKVGDLEVHRHERSDGGGTVFTWHPKTRQIHHVITYTRKGNNLEGVTGNGRPGSKVKYHDVLHHLAHDHGESIITRSSSEGAAKSWNKLRTKKGVKVQKFDHSTAKWKDTTHDEPLYDTDHKSEVGSTPIRVTKA